MTLHCACNECSKPMAVEFEPNDFVSEKFLRLMAVCQQCGYTVLNDDGSWIDKMEGFTTPTKPYNSPHNDP